MIRKLNKDDLKNGQIYIKDMQFLQGSNEYRVF